VQVFDKVAFDSRRRKAGARRLRFNTYSTAETIAMCRKAAIDGLADMFKMHASNNPARIFTKLLMGEKFREMRARVLSLLYIEPRPKAQNAEADFSIPPPPQTDQQKTSVGATNKSAAQLPHEHQDGNECSSDVAGDGASAMSDSDDDDDDDDDYDDDDYDYDYDDYDYDDDGDDYYYHISATDGSGVTRHFYIRQANNASPFLAPVPPAGPAPAPVPVPVAPAVSAPVAPAPEPAPVPVHAVPAPVAPDPAPAPAPDPTAAVQGFRRVPASHPENGGSGGSTPARRQRLVYANLDSTGRAADRFAQAVSLEGPRVA
jgi:hypothetical protein